MLSFPRRVASWFGRRTQPAVDADIACQGELKVALDRLVEKSFAAGVSVERARIAEILQLPGASKFQGLVVDLALGGDATPQQVAMVISRTEVAVEARLHPTEAAPPERSTPTFH